MKKILINILCGFIPSKNIRHKVRNKFANQNQNQKNNFESINYNFLIKSIQRSITTAILHQNTFAKYRNKHHNKNLVIIGAGPTVNFFEKIKTSSIYIGLNRACLLKDINFDYLFAIDKAGLDVGEENYYKEFMTNKAIKFIGDQNLGINYQIPYSKFAGYKNVYCYKTTAGYLPDKITYDIDCEPLANSCSIAIQAMQFAMFTNPKKIYLVGIDCTIHSQGHFMGKNYDNKKRNENTKINDFKVVDSWKQIKEFISIYYPDTEIISVNPVGLKGLFHDVYTESYLKEHPEINRKEIEILKEE